MTAVETDRESRCEVAMRTEKLDSQATAVLDQFQGGWQIRSRLSLSRSFKVIHHHRWIFTIMIHGH